MYGSRRILQSANLNDDSLMPVALVVQHMFENCVEDDTRDCLEEVFSGFSAVVRDQWGAFVIQHRE